jgi:outer membrane protein assembly factor BamB
MKIVIVVLLLLVSSVCGQAQTVSPQLPLVRVDRIGEATARSFFVFSTSMRNYAIRHDGHGESWSTNTMRKNFDLRMGGAGRLERLYFVEYESDLILEYEVTDQRGDWGYVLRMDQKTMKLKWIMPLSANNLGPGLIAATDLYFSASNFLARLDLPTGAFVWQQAQPDHEWAFGIPTLKGGKIVFQDEGETGRVVEVDTNTGRPIKNK